MVVPEIDAVTVGDAVADDVASKELDDDGEEDIVANKLFEEVLESVFVCVPVRLRLRDSDSVDDAVPVTNVLTESDKVNVNVSERLRVTVEVAE